MEEAAQKRQEAAQKRQEEAQKRQEEAQKRLEEAQKRQEAELKRLADRLDGDWRVVVPPSAPAEGAAAQPKANKRAKPAAAEK